ncbi:MAG: hypothetical protein Q7R45_02625 [Sulfuricaulis sp.]|nr:hypothetical protein [Sulfuricaulis sp.]
MALLAELVAQHPKTAGRVTKLGGGLVGGEMVDEVSPQRFVLAVSGAGGDEEGALLGC